MPKIRQAISVFVVAALCIGFNTYRYPVVREMMAAMSQPASAAEAKPAEKTADSAKPGDSSASDAAGGSKHPASVVCKDGVCAMAMPESPSASLGSTFGGDATQSAPKPSEEKPATSEESPTSADAPGSPYGESPSKSKLDAASPEAKSSAPSDTTPKDETAKSEAGTSGAESYSPDAAAKYDPAKTPEYNAAGETPETKVAAKLVSTPGDGSAASSSPGGDSFAQVTLVPIRRSRPQAESEQAASGKPAYDPKPDANPGNMANGVRRLPSVDPVAIADAANPTEDQSRTYPVTSAP